MFARAQELEDALREKRKAKTLSAAKLAALEKEWKRVQREARESLGKGEAIEDAVYDLKAVNPNRVTEEDTRTPPQLLDVIAEKGREAEAALDRLRALVGRSAI